ncbi:PREDICTED: putative uncharacterized protein FLJ37770 [Rhagoletis zephyria]|uniref:putative uncharacterized protein FLJ37770 n=1 Tax=Rhagoletis zephyria TaxID=28612 RepID=UPI0008114EB7|nr:PREDICTED: putative uncharacterized protein FLJ37770 [Rhagoletis zephyria]
MVKVTVMIKGMVMVITMVIVTAMIMVVIMGNGNGNGNAYVSSLKTPRCLVYAWQPSIENAFSEFVKTEKIGHRYVIQYSFTTVKYWVAEFKRGRTRSQDEHRSGRPNEVTTPEMVKKIHKAVMDDRRPKVPELADIVGISKSTVHRILSENLEMRKQCPRWVPHLLTLDQKQCREEVSIECLAN